VRMLAEMVQDMYKRQFGDRGTDTLEALQRSLRIINAIPGEQDRKKEEENHEKDKPKPTEEAEQQNANTEENQNANTEENQNANTEEKQNANTEEKQNANTEENPDENTDKKPNQNPDDESPDENPDENPDEKSPDENPDKERASCKQCMAGLATSKPQSECASCKQCMAGLATSKSNDTLKKPILKKILKQQTLKNPMKTMHAGSTANLNDKDAANPMQTVTHLYPLMYDCNAYDEQIIEWDPGPPKTLSLQ